MVQHHEHSRVLDLYHELSKMCSETVSDHVKVTMPQMIRAFIAIPLDPAIRANLAAFITRYRLSRETGFRPVKADIIHLTLKFLGDTTREQLQQILSGLDQIIHTSPAFPLAVENVGAFPNWERARVVWAGVKSPVALQTLYARIDQHTEELGFPSEGKRFTPHLTLARLTTTPPETAAVPIVNRLRTITPAPVFGEMQAREVILFQSTLTPQGPIHTPVSRHAFQD